MVGQESPQRAFRRAGLDSSPSPLLVAVCALLVSACGSSSASPNTTSAPATTTATGGATTTAGASGSAGFAAYRSCLQAHGVTFPAGWWTSSSAAASAPAEQRPEWRLQERPAGRIRPARRRQGHGHRAASGAARAPRPSRRPSRPAPACARQAAALSAAAAASAAWRQVCQQPGLRQVPRLPAKPRRPDRIGSRSDVDDLLLGLRSSSAAACPRGRLRRRRLRGGGGGSSSGSSSSPSGAPGASFEKLQACLRAHERQPGAASASTRPRPGRSARPRARSQLPNGGNGSAAGNPRRRRRPSEPGLSSLASAVAGRDR